MELFRNLIEEAVSLLNDSKPDEALIILRKAETRICEADEYTLVLRDKIAVLLIDIGEELSKPELIQEGLSFLEQNADEIGRATDYASLYYNIGNGKCAQYTLCTNKNPGKFNPKSIELLSKAKDYYWKAMRNSLPESSLKKLNLNLANSLDSSGRLVEALFWYDQALLIDPAFGMAHYNKALALEFLNRLSGSFSISLIEEISKSFTYAKADPNIFPHLADQAQKQIELLQLRLQELGWDDERIAEYDKQHETEYKLHDDYWKFCLDNHLALSEHGLYCKCAGARRDDLSIAKQSGSIAGNFVPKLELLLNRLKSEFCYARALYHQFLIPETKWSTDAYQSTFTDLHEGEAIGIEEEFLRNSFKLCFGILDKIAQGLNELFSFAELNETLYFESFWRIREKKGAERWELINSQTNTSLVALFSLATDLNSKNGEWGFFKKYRNLMEHGLLVLLQDGHSKLSEDLSPERVQFETVPISEFEKHTLQMLQFTRSAIFSFAFCVRIEGQKKLKENKKEIATKLHLGKKAIGKE